MEEEARMKSPRLATIVCAIAATTGGAAQAAQKETPYPTRPIRMIVPFAPGGATDIVARLVAPGLAEVLGQQVVVDNRGGAAGNLALELAARAQPDGYTVLVGNVSTNTINPITFASTLKTDPLKELAPVTALGAVANVLVAGAAFPPNTLKEVIEYTRARPGQLNYSNPLGAYSHLDMLEFTAKAGLRMVNVPSKGAGASFAPVISGEIHYSFLNAATTTPQIRAGRMKAYVTTADKRLPELPDVPTTAEAGFPTVNGINWSGLFVPAKTPAAVVERLHAATLQVMQRPSTRDSFAKTGITVTTHATPAEFQRYVTSEVERWSRIIRENNVRID